MQAPDILYYRNKNYCDFLWWFHIDELYLHQKQ